MSHTKQFEHLKIQLEAIISATNNFAAENCIGKGGFGKVYKGEIDIHSKGQSMVAFKRLDRAFGQGNPEFWKEIMMLSIYRHENIVSLLGFCDESDEKILVYEYASRRSLDLYLNNDGLTWIQRLRICIGAARGLAYLHNPIGMQLRVLHRDIKSSNILLDENWNAKISDFGLSKLGPANHQFSFLVSNAVGTIGYCDPLYVEMGFLTKESDVYSFGVVLFEVLCGRLCVRNNNDNYQPLTRLVRECYENNKINEIIHGSIKDEIDPNSLKLFTRIAYQCLKREREERPLMSEIVRILETALGYQDKSWKLPDIIDSSHLKALWLPDTMAANKVMRLIYTNSGLSLLALTSNAVLKLWECHNGPNLVSDGASVFYDSGLFHPQQQQKSNMKKCAFIGCTRGAADKTAFCKAHGGGRRCEILGCTKTAKGPTNYCISHGGGRRCEFLGCIKTAKGPTNYCIDHGGGVRCINEGCTRAARGMSGLCTWHGSERIPSGKSTTSIVPQLWQPINGALMSNDVSESKPAQESAACIALSTNDSFLISASGGKVSLFNMMTRKVMTTFMPPSPAATYLAFHPQDINIVAIGMEDSTIQIYNVRDDEVKIKLKGHQKQITGLAFSQTLNALVSSGADAQLCIWNINGWEKRKSRSIQSPPGHPSSLVGETRVQFHNDQRHILVVHESQIAIYDYQLECLRLWSPSESISAPISSAIYSCNNLLLFTGFLDGAVGVFDAGSLRLRCRISPFAYISSSISSSNINAYPVDIAAHPSDSNQFALGMNDGSVHVIEPAAGEKTWGVSEPQEDGSMASLNPSSSALNSEPSELSSTKRYKIAPS